MEDKEDFLVNKSLRPILVAFLGEGSVTELELSRTRRRLVWPAFLSIVAASGPFLIAWSDFAFAPYIYGEQYGVSNGPLEAFLAVLNGIFFVVLGLMLIRFSIAELILWDHRQKWGLTVAALFTFWTFIALYGGSSTTLYRIDLSTIPGFLLLTIGPSAGFFGGILGAFWRQPENPIETSVPMTKPIRLVLIGGIVISTYSLLLRFWNVPLFILPPLVALSSSLLLLWTRGQKRLLGITTTAASLTTGLIFYQFANGIGAAVNPYGINVNASPHQILGIAGLIGVGLSVAGGVKLAFMRTKSHTRQIEEAS